MSEQSKDGGPAFPRTGGEVPGPNVSEWVTPQSGMSLRDYFAAHAPAPESDSVELHARLDRSRNPHNEPHKPKIRDRHEIVAALAYRYADAMLAARTTQGA